MTDRNESNSASPSDSNLALDGSSFDMLREVEVELTVEIGRCRRRIADVLKLMPGQTLEIAKAAGEPIDLYVNGQLLARGEAVVVGDRYGVRITELVGGKGGRP